MTDETWARGMHDLIVAFPERDMTDGYASDRGELYRTHLDDLHEMAWLYAVTEAVENERWFPSIAALREYASAWRVPDNRRLRATRTEAEREADREVCKRGLDLIKAAMVQTEVAK